MHSAGLTAVFRRGPARGSIRVQHFAEMGETMKYATRGSIQDDKPRIQSGEFLLACQLTFFTAMGTLIILTVAYSLGYSLLFFMPLLAWPGPRAASATSATS